MFLSYVLAAAALAPASDASVDAFIAAIPPKTPKSAKMVPFDAEQLKDLKARNPGREADVDTLFAASQQCKAASGEKAVMHSLRDSARRLGDEKLQRLTAFYKSADFAAFDRIAAKREAEQSLTEKQEFARIKAAYPLQDYLESSKQTASEMMSNGAFFSALEACDRQLDEDLTKRKLKH
jgi:hypothetical protein